MSKMSTYIVSLCLIECLVVVPLAYSPGTVGVVGFVASLVIPLIQIALLVIQIRRGE